MEILEVRETNNVFTIWPFTELRFFCYLFNENEEKVINLIDVMKTQFNATIKNENLPHFTEMSFLKKEDAILAKEWLLNKIPEKTKKTMIEQNEEQRKWLQSL